MRVRFSADVMADHCSWRHLDRMVMLFEDGRHDWLADNPEEIMASRWAQDDPGRAGASARKALQEHIRWAVYPKDRLAITVESTSSSGTRLGPDDAVRALEEMVWVAVENSTTDGGFLLTLISVLDRVDLWYAYEQKWLHFYQMGGYGEVEKVIATLRQGTPRPCRVFVLADSDARLPGETTPTVRKVTSACTVAGVPFTILSKRKIENYLPISVLQRHSSGSKPRVFQAFQKLTDEQRSYYEMKRGFAVDSAGMTVVPTEQSALFAGVGQQVLDDLRGGFGADIAGLFTSERDRITRADIRQVCTSAPGELGLILDQIERLL